MRNKKFLWILLFILLFLGASAIMLTTDKNTEQAMLEQIAQEQLAARASALDKLTVSYTEEELARYTADALLVLNQPDLIYPRLLKNMAENLEIKDITLTLASAELGSGDFSFTGFFVDEFFRKSVVDMDRYAGCRFASLDNQSYPYTRKEIEAMPDLFIAFYCDGLPFGFPQDGGIGPYLLINAANGTAEIIAQQLVSVGVN